jgi:hypothetical protein
MVELTSLEEKFSFQQYDRPTTATLKNRDRLAICWREGQNGNG